MGLKNLAARGLIVSLSFFASTAAWAQACAPIRNKVVSISIGFNYKGDAIHLPGSGTDAEYYKKRIGETVANQGHVLRDGDAPDKKSFLNRLRELVKGKEYVNFNFAGHGFISSDGEYGIALPSIPQDLAKKCAGSAFRDPEQVGHRDKINDKPVKPQLADCSEIKNHMVSQSELREIFGDRKVFGFADSCHSGDLDLGENSMMMVASRRNELASEIRGDQRGAFTAALDKRLLNCNSDEDKDGFLSLGEVAKRMTHVKATGRQAFLGYTRNGPMGVMRTDGNVQRPGRTGAMGTSWASCVMLARSQCATSELSGGAKPAKSPTTTSTRNRR